MSVHADMQFYAQVFTKLTDVEQNYLQTHKIATGKSSIVNWSKSCLYTKKIQI